MADFADVTPTSLNHRVVCLPVAEAAEQSKTDALAQVFESKKPARRQRPSVTLKLPIDQRKISIEPTASKPSEPATVPNIRKCDGVLSLLRREGGATIREIMAVTHWQAHSVRGFLSGTVRKKMSVDLLSEVTGEGTRRYRIASDDCDETSDNMPERELTDLPAFLPFRQDLHANAAATNAVATGEVLL